MTPDPTPEHVEALRDALSVWAPTYPRRVSKKQAWAETPREAEETLLGEHGDGPGYISVYAFPDGHSSDGEVPAVDTMFVDFDIPANGEYGRPGPGDADMTAWMNDIGPLLDAVSGIAEALIEEDGHHYVRAALSGHKGVHLFFDFPELRTDIGGQGQFKAGLSKYGGDLIRYLAAKANVDVSRWLDVDSSDLSRLTRCPNTLHEGATAAFDRDSYCVPVSVEELVGLTPAGYLMLTARPRSVPEAARRIESENAATVIGQYVAGAGAANHTDLKIRGTSITAYKENADPAVTLQAGATSVRSILTDRQCMWEFRSRPDCFDHGAQSHYFEFAIILELVLRRVPIEVIVEFFRPCVGFDEGWTRSQIHRVIAQGYGHTVSAQRLAQKAPVFLRADACEHCKFALEQRSATTTAP